MTDRCMDCPRDATHTLKWYPKCQEWSVQRLYWASKRQRTLHRYCRWHATVQGVQLNARGITPPRSRDVRQ